MVQCMSVFHQPEICQNSRMDHAGFWLFFFAYAILYFSGIHVSPNISRYFPLNLVPNSELGQFSAFFARTHRPSQVYRTEHTPMCTAFSCEAEHHAISLRQQRLIPCVAWECCVMLAAAAAISHYHTSDSRRSYQIIKFLVSLVNKCPLAKDYLLQAATRWQWAVNWLKSKVCVHTSFLLMWHNCSDSHSLRPLMNISCM